VLVNHCGSRCFLLHDPFVVPFQQHVMEEQALQIAALHQHFAQWQMLAKAFVFGLASKRLVELSTCDDSLPDPKLAAVFDLRLRCFSCRKSVSSCFLAISVIPPCNLEKHLLYSP
jgi:hypothetical protein